MTVQDSIQVGVSTVQIHILIQPYFDARLTSARAEYISICGKIISKWELDGALYSLHVTIPANTTATVSIPANAEIDVTEGPHSAAQAEGVTFVRQEGNRALFESLGVHSPTLASFSRGAYCGA